MSETTRTAPKPARKFSWRERGRSFLPAVRGVADLLRTQHNTRIHGVATVLVIAAGLACGVTRAEWCLLVLAITVVWVTEGLNTAIEFLADEVSVEHRPLIGRAKDAGAAAVLICSLGAAAIGALVFLPYFVSLLLG